MFKSYHPKKIRTVIIIVLLACFPHFAVADLNIGGKTIFSGNLIEVLAPGPDLPTILANIDDASDSNPYLVKLGPGIYDLGASTLQMKSNVEIRGSGQGLTIIKGNVSAESWSSAALILGANDATLSHLTVDNIGNTYSLSAAMYNVGTEPLLKHVTLKVYSTGNRIPVHNYNGASPRIIDAVLTAGDTQTALYNYLNCEPKVIRSYLEGGIGVYASGNSKAIIEHSYIAANSIYPTVRTETGGQINVFSSTLDGGPADALSGGVAPKCSGVTDENYTFYPSTCP